MIYNNILDLIGNTPLVKYSENILLKLENFNPSGSIKDRASYQMIKSAIDREEIGADTVIIEATSGNTGIAFSALGAYYGHPVHIFMPDNASVERIKIMELYGAKVYLVSKDAGGFKEAIRRADELAKEINGFRPDQFNNVMNVDAHYNMTGVEILNKLDVKTLSDKPYQYKDSNDKDRESASRKEEYYTLKTDLLLKSKQFDECIFYCNEAFEEIASFHYGNEIWLERRIALALEGMGEAAEAIDRLKKLIVTSDKWFLLYEIGKLYLKLGRKNDALQYMLKALCTKDPERMKVKLIEQLGDVLLNVGETEYVQENYLLSLKIRRENDWFVKDNLMKKVKEEREVSFKEVRKHWIQLLYKFAEKKTGTISRLLPGNKAGFIKAEQSYYFQSKNFFGRIDILKVGDSVDFSTCVSYDRKKQQETIEAIAITPSKR
jgi:tetratricopeptide (TPR) repeat protein